MEPPQIEKQLGIEVYATHSKGIGGIIRENPEDFVVEEILLNGLKAEATISKTENNKTLGFTPKENGYLLCVLVKKNWDTFSAISQIAHQLNISPAQIQIAGIKDAKALTAQHITIRNISAEQIRRIHLKDIEIHAIGFVRNKLSAYYLLGNQFQILIKKVKLSRYALKKNISATIGELSLIGGLPNFFGHQRFGTVRPITHLVGKAIIKGDFHKATMVFLAQSSISEHASSRRARDELLTTQNFEKALTDFPEQLRYEKSMIKYLVRHPDDFVNAFKTLPFKLQELFVQAYESYLFNKALSARMAQTALMNVAQIGDYAVSVERSGLPSKSMFKVVTGENLSEINSSIQLGKMRIALPLIGYKQSPSRGMQGEIEKRVLDEEGVSPKEFYVAKMPEVSSKGGLRVASTPIESFCVNKVSENSEVLHGNEAKVSFMLHRGSYATMLLREIMKPKDLIWEGF